MGMPGNLVEPRIRNDSYSLLSVKTKNSIEKKSFARKSNSFSDKKEGRHMSIPFYVGVSISTCYSLLNLILNPQLGIQLKAI